MDTRDLLILGGIGVAAYFGWRWYNRNVQTAQGSPAAARELGNTAGASMTADAARTTVFGGGVSFRRLLSPPTVSKLPLLPRPTDPPAPSPETPGLRAFVLRAVLGPQLVAPSPDATRLVPSVGTSALEGTTPNGDQPNPGDPDVVFYSRRGIA